MLYTPAMAEEPTEPVKILSIGNSFSQDIQTYIEEISSSAGVDVVVGNLNRSGESLEGHWKQAAQSRKSYTYEKKNVFNGEWTVKSKKYITLKDGLKDENWDYITVQQTSGKSGLYRTYNPYLGKLMNYISANQKNPDAQVAIHMTWAYSKNSTHKYFPYYGKNQWSMYQAITNATLQVMKDHQIDLVLPTGTAIQNARSHPDLNSYDQELTADGHHLSELGDYIGGLVLFETLIAEPYQKDLFKDVTFHPKEITSEQAYLAKLAVKKAVEDPFDVTNLELIDQKSVSINK